MQYVLLSRDGRRILLANSPQEVVANLLGCNISEWMVFRECTLPTANMNRLIEHLQTCENVEQCGVDVYRDMELAA